MQSWIAIDAVFSGKYDWPRRLGPQRHNHELEVRQLQKALGQACDACGVTWTEFRQGGLFGCPNDYTLFEKDLTPLLQRAHEGATHHVGKVPTRRGGTGVPMKRQVDLTKLRKELAKAVEAEDYERAAKLRDQIRQAEG